MATMDNPLHAAGERAGRLHHKNARRRAGLPAKRFFTRFRRLSDVPPEDLELLSESLRNALDVDPSSPVPDLQALVRQEFRNRGEAGHG
ncbi:hypothetical protein [Pseudarthrobacter sp. NS4]|uniref:hypothetical protein n=1 Tax=Pseudarthrobacter sp. NS4 TaxID=2973976 RepID=UPI002161957D|nr:hypothetical protein [Pseudarthrobacter sp. NS4]